MVYIIKPISAQLMHDKDFISKMDPYCICTIGHEKKKTKPHSGGGKHPQWYDTLEFQSTDMFMKLQVYDHDLIKDDLIGEANVSLNQLLSSPGISDNEYVDITYHGKKTGRVLISLEYQGPAQGGWGNNSNQGGWGNNPNQNQSSWGNNPNQGGGWGNNSNQGGGWGNNPNQGGGWGNNPNQGGYNPNQGGGWGNEPNQGGWGNNPNQGGWGNEPNQGGWGNNPNQGGGWGNNPNSGWN